MLLHTVEGIQFYSRSHSRYSRGLILYDKLLCEMAERSLQANGKDLLISFTIGVSNFLFSEFFF